MFSGDNFKRKDEGFVVSDNVVIYVFRRHGDWVNMLGLQSVGNIRTFITNVRYFLLRISSDLWLCVISLGSELA